MSKLLKELRLKADIMTAQNEVLALMYELDELQKQRVAIPLPGLETTDGEAQYLSRKNGKWFASRQNDNLEQQFFIEEVPKPYSDFETIDHIEFFRRSLKEED